MRSFDRQTPMIMLQKREFRW